MSLCSNELSSSQGSGASAQPSRVSLSARTFSCGTSLRGSAGGDLPSVAVATEAALPAPPVDVSLLRPWRLLLLPASVRQPAEAAGEAQAALRPGVFAEMTLTPDLRWMKHVVDRASERFIQRLYMSRFDIHDTVWTKTERNGTSRRY